MVRRGNSTACGDDLKNSDRLIVNSNRCNVDMSITSHRPRSCPLEGLSKLFHGSVCLASVDGLEDCALRSKQRELEIPPVLNILITVLCSSCRHACTLKVEKTGNITNGISPNLLLRQAWILQMAREAQLLRGRTCPGGVVLPVLLSDII